MKELGPRAFYYGHPAPVCMVATYNDDETVNVMNLHEVARTNAGDLALCIGPGKKNPRKHWKKKSINPYIGQ